MQARPPESESLTAIVGVVLRVAEAHGSQIRLADLLQLLPEGTTQDQAAAALENVHGLGPYTLRDGLLVPRDRDMSHVRDSGRLDNSLANIAFAKWFVQGLVRRGVRAVAVSGSTSYKAASDQDDVDLFCITAREEMWIFLTRALVLTRVMRLSRVQTPPVCLSCVMDEDYARRVFREDRGALFARDALVAEPVHGTQEYRRLLRSAGWMERYFPKLYMLRTSGAGSPEAKAPTTAGKRLLNRLLYATVGTFIRSKSRYHNAGLARAGRTASTFRARVGPDHLIYESTKYLKLKRVYDGIPPTQESTEPAPLEASSYVTGLSTNDNR